MEKGKNFQRLKNKIELLQSGKKIGKPGYLNKNCWLVESLNYIPHKRCQYCELKFSNCLFFQYLIISLILALSIFILSFFTEGRIANLIVISVFALIVVYGYFFNKSTENIIKSNFAQIKANEALKELTQTLEERVKKRTNELEKTNFELKKAYIKLTKLDKAKSEFISITSHQLRTPLTIIKGYVSTILDGTYGKIPEDIQKPLKNAYISNERLIKLVNDILDISRIESGRMELNFKKTSLEEIIFDVIEELKSKAEEKNLYLRFEKSKEKFPRVLIDRDKIRQVILNIVDNAIKYTNQGGVIIKLKIKKNQKSEIESREVEGDSIIIEISDTGEGINKEEVAHLFQSFSRGESGKKSWIAGSGLGLYIAKKLIKMHYGEIWAESPGKEKGSTFYIKLNY